MLSSPPRMTTGNTFIPMDVRSWTLMPLMIPRTMPLMAATRAAMAQESANTRLTFTPSERAAGWLSATDRM
jgi:hypothetical protein